VENIAISIRFIAININFKRNEIKNYKRNREFKSLIFFNLDWRKVFTHSKTINDIERNTEMRVDW
jgi:hypothetical protein